MAHVVIFWKKEHGVCEVEAVDRVVREHLGPDVWDTMEVDSPTLEDKLGCRGSGDRTDFVYHDSVLFGFEGGLEPVEGLDPRLNYATLALQFSDVSGEPDEVAERARRSSLFKALMDAMGPGLDVIVWLDQPEG